MTRKMLLFSTVGAVALFTEGARAAEVTPLSEFDMSQYQDGWTADGMLDTTVYGEDGSVVGEVQNIIMTSDGQVDRLIVETDNWLDIGDRVISVPWSNVERMEGQEGIQTQLDEDHMDDFSLFSGDEVETGSQAFRAGELLDDYVELEDGSGYGYVSDIVFSQDGKLEAVVVTPDVVFGPSDYAGGRYGYPFYGYDYGFDPYAPTYGLPYTEDEVAGYEPLDEGLFDDDVF